ncbi:MAG: hypothetical protein LBJ69_03675, partial [Holosporales bacterium]|jgi:hypothetical protein|nr:hypothetical protein [Holosporales bacterium]
VEPVWRENEELSNENADLHDEIDRLSRELADAREQIRQLTSASPIPNPHQMQDNGLTVEQNRALMAADACTTSDFWICHTEGGTPVITASHAPYRRIFIRLIDPDSTITTSLSYCITAATPGHDLAQLQADGRVRLLTNGLRMWSCTSTSGQPKPIQDTERALKSLNRRLVIEGKPLLVTPPTNR